MAKKDKKAKSIESDVYTAVLGLAALVLAATTAAVCVYAQQMWGDIFRVTG